MGTLRSLSSCDAIIRTATPQFELLQPFYWWCVSIGHGGGRSHEDEARQQGEDEDEPLGIHGGCRRRGRGRLEDTAMP